MTSAQVHVPNIRQRWALALAIAGFLLAFTPASAGAAPVLKLDIHHNQTHFPPGGTAEYWFDVDNVGPDPTSGTVNLTVTLPTGLTRESVRVADVIDETNWNCPGSAGDSIINCSTSDVIPRHTNVRGLVLSVAIDPDVTGLKFTSATLTGGGAAPVPTAFERTEIDPQPAGFGILPETFVPDFFEADRSTPERRAGSHPDLLTVPFDFNSISDPISFGAEKSAAGSVRNIHVDTPAGFLGAPTAVAECPQASFAVQECPSSSVVGRLDIRIAPIGSPAEGNSFAYRATPVYNLDPPHGVVSDLAFVVGGNPVHVRASLDPGNNYAITTTVPNINETLPPFDQKLTLWGVPADPSHDSERCKPENLFASIDTSEECASSAEVKPFLTLPSQCSSAAVFRLHHYDSWQQRGTFGPDIDRTLPDQFTGCEAVPFDPEVTVVPTTQAAGSPSGLDVNIELPQNNDCEEIVPAPPAGEPRYDCGIATSPLKDATVTLPEGLTVNPASANGLDVCSLKEISLGTDEPVRCPEASRVANVEIETPLLPDPVDGTVYLATPHENPFDSLLAGYIVLSDPGRGLLIKIPGKIEADEETGQITGIFNDNPQLPFSEFDLHFKGGAHSTLTTPETCGDYSASARLAPWSETDTVSEESEFSITRGADGSCETNAANMPKDPSFETGTVRPVAGAYSPFVVNLRREDGSQRFKALEVSPPEGLVAKLAGIPYCSDSDLQAAEEKTGKEEQADPSCPLASEIGKVWAAAGSGPSPYWTDGTVYLSGPYKGAPLSLSIVMPAVAGPFDLGNVVVKTALHVDPRTAEITAISDEIPEMLEGIPLNVKQISIRLNRNEFTVNPTNCTPMGVSGELVTTLSQTAELFNRFQVGECRRLGFSPRFAMQMLNGGRKSTLRSFNPAMRFALAPPPGQANIDRAAVTLPSSIILDQGNLDTICTRDQLAADNCPEGSFVGFAKAWTPLLAEPLQGRVFLASSDNLLPDLVADLRGQVRILLRGVVDAAKGRMRNTFNVVPDVPVSRFALTLLGGKNRGILVNSTDLCKSRERGVANFMAQNGRRHVLRPPVRTRFRGCKQVIRKEAMQLKQRRMKIVRAFKQGRISRAQAKRALQRLKRAKAASSAGARRAVRR